jgi:hypothetical protein
MARLKNRGELSSKTKNMIHTNRDQGHIQVTNNFAGQKA